MESDFEIVNWGRYFASMRMANCSALRLQRGAVAVKKRIEELKTQLEEAHKGISKPKPREPKPCGMNQPRAFNKIAVQNVPSTDLVLPLDC